MTVWPDSPNVCVVRLWGFCNLQAEDWLPRSSRTTKKEKAAFAFFPSGASKL